MLAAVPAMAQQIVNKNAGWVSEWTTRLGPFEAGSAVPRMEVSKAFQRENYKKAARVAREWTISQPDNFEAWGWLAAACSGAKQWQEGEQSATRLLAFSDVPSSYRSAGLNNRANCRFHLKKFAGAEADSRQAMQLRPDADNQNQLAWFLATCPDSKMRNGREAVALANRALKLNSDPAIMDTLAAAYAETGDFPSAVEWQKKANKDPKTNKEGAKRLKLYQGNRPYRDDA